MSWLQFSALLGVQLVRDMLCLYEQPAQRFHTLMALGTNVCGHRFVFSKRQSFLLCDDPALTMLLSAHTSTCCRDCDMKP